MALRIKLLNNADQAITYFLSHYHVKGEERGIWMGKMAERLDLARTITRADFEAVMSNQRPGAPEERLTQRTNTTRRATVWEKDAETKLWVEVEKEVPNCRIAADLTFSLRKEQSTYLEASKDQLYRSFALLSLKERLEAIEAETQTRVRKGGLQETRVTGEALFAVFEDHTTRPIDGIPDPHDHWHCLMANATWDAIENECKAAELEKVFRNKAYHEAVWHARIDEMAMDAGYGHRRTAKGLELSIFDQDECKIFCKRTKQIEALEKRLHDDLMRQATAIVAMAAKGGLLRDVDSEYAKLKDQLGEKSRQGKNTALYKEGPELDRAWSNQMRAGRWESLTPENARTGERINVLAPAAAKELTISRVFERKSRVRDVDLFKVACVYCAGSMRVKEIDDFCRTDARLVRNPVEPGTVTTHAIAAEEQKIQDTVIATKSLYTPLAQGRGWDVMDKGLDEKQLAAAELILETRDMAVAIPGLTGSGKSRTVKEAAHAIKEITGRPPIVLAPKGKNAIALKEHTGGDAHTIALYRANEKLQVKDSCIFCDEFSQVGNEDCQWLLDHCLANRNRLVFFGDETQYQGIARGDPVADLLSAGLIEFRHLDKIYRQQSAELLEAVTHSAHGRFEESVRTVKEQGWFVTRENEDDVRSALVVDLVGKLKRDEPVMAIAMTHHHIEQITSEVREALKEEGLIAKEDYSVRCLKDLKMSEAERRDAISYQPGMVVKFHRRVVGGLKSGEAWNCDRIEEDQVIIRRAGQEAILPRDQAAAFQVYEAETMLLSAGDRVLITKNNPAANIRTGDIRTIQSFDERYLTFDNGKKVTIDEGVHIRSGYAMTGYVSQGEQAPDVLPYLPASVSHMINQRSWHTAISRAVDRLRVYTNCVPLIEQKAVMPEDRESALSLINGKAKETDQIREVDLQASKTHWHHTHEPTHQEPEREELEIER